MRNYTRTAVILALLSGSASSVKLSHRSKDPEMQKLIDNAVMDAAAAKSPDVAKLYPTDEETKEKEDAQKAITAPMEGALARNILDAFNYDLSNDALTKVASLKAYHEMMLRYDVANSVGDIMNPELEKVITTMNRATDVTGMVGKKEAADAAKKDLEDFPNVENYRAVYNPPKNDPDLKNLVDSVVLQVNGEAVVIQHPDTYVQTNSQTREIQGFDDEATTLQVNGVPVFVNPTLLKNQVGHDDLSQRDYLIDGVNGFDFVQQKSQWVDDEQIQDKNDQLVKQKDNDWTVHFTSFAQEQTANENEQERLRRLNGESNFGDKAPEMIQLKSKWIDDDKVLDKADLKQKASIDDQVHLISFAQDEKAKDAEEERVNRLNGESNFADKAPEMVQLNTKWIDDDQVLDKADLKPKASIDDQVHFTSFAQDEKAKDAEEERVNRLNGESNSLDKAPELVQLSDNDEADNHFLHNISIAQQSVIRAESERSRKINGMSNTDDKAPSYLQVGNRWVDDDDELILKVPKAENKIDYSTHFSSFAQQKVTKEDEEEHTKRRNGESNYADKAPEMVQLKAEWIDDDKVLDKRDQKPKDSFDDQVHFINFAQNSKAKEDEEERKRRLNGESNFADQAPELVQMVQLQSGFVDEDKIYEKVDLKSKQKFTDDYNTKYSSFAQQQFDATKEEERTKRLNGQSNYADSAPKEDEFVVLQVKGVPVYVNPESLLLQDQVWDFSFGHKLAVGPHEVTYVQEGQKIKDDDDPLKDMSIGGSPVHFNKHANKHIMKYMADHNGIDL